MANIQFIEISLNMVLKFTQNLKFDIYVRRSKDQYTKIFNQSDEVDPERVTLYQKKGITNFFVDEKSYKVYTLYLDQFGDSLAKNLSSLTPDESLELLKELIKHTTRQLIIDQRVDEKVIQGAANIVGATINEMTRNPKVLVNLLTLLTNHSYMLKHATMVSLFSILLAQKLNFSGRVLEQIGMGAFLHDLGVGQLSFDPEGLEVLTPKQRKEVWRHPEIGAQLLDGIKGISTEVQHIILQHHEQPNGAGYPNNLRNAEIYPPAKIVAIADAFCALITKRSWRDAFSKEHALQIMIENTGRYDSKFIETFTKIFIKTKS